MDSAGTKLRTTNCAECGYRLEGLPEAGRCPECGAEYSPERLVLFGWAFGKKRTIANSRQVKWWMFSAAGMYLVLAIAWTGRKVSRAWPWMILAGLYVGIALFRWMKRRQWAREELKPMQLRVFPEGFACVEGYGQKIVKMEPWWRAENIQIVPAGTGLYRIQMGIRAAKSFKLELKDLSALVEFEFEGDEAMAAELRERIAVLRRRAEMGVQQVGGGTADWTATG